MQTEITPSATDHPAPAPASPAVAEASSLHPAPLPALGTVLVRQRHGLKAIRLKRCRACGAEKMVSAFRKAPSGGREKHRAECRSCEARGRTAKQQGQPIWAPDAGAKLCRSCGFAQPLAKFREDRRSADGRANVCERCFAAVEFKRWDPVNLEASDESLGMNSAAKERRTDLGIAIAHATCPPGYPRSREELAAYADVSVEAIRRIENEALRKVRAGVGALLEAARVTRQEVGL